MVGPTLPENCSVYNCGNLPPDFKDSLFISLVSCGEFQPGVPVQITWGSFTFAGVDPENPGLYLVTYEGMDAYSGFTLEVRSEYPVVTVDCGDGFDLYELTLTVTDPCGNTATTVFMWPYIVC